MLFNKGQSIVSGLLLSLIASSALVAGMYSARYVYSQTMTSGAYRIQSDSVNFAGGRSTSTSYFIEDTAGELATGESTSSNFKMKAGYQQMQEIIISATAAADVVMSPALGGVTGGASNGETSFTVTTDNPAGYTVTIKASSSPALWSPLDTFADYPAPATNPDYNLSIAPTQSVFAFTPEGNDIADSFKDDGVDCNTGSGDTSYACWAGLSTSAQTIVSRTSANHTSGTLTTIKFLAQVGSARVQKAGNYTATTTLTILPL